MRACLCVCASTQINGNCEEEIPQQIFLHLIFI